jgi:hypothetical protein
VHPEVVYELVFLQAEPAQEGAWRLPGERGPAAWKAATSLFCWPTSRLRRWGLPFQRRSSNWRAVAA